MKSLPFSLHRRQRRGSAIGKDTVFVPFAPAALLVVYIAALVGASASAVDMQYSPEDEVICSAVAALGAAGALLGGRRWRPLTLVAVFALTLLVRKASGSLLPAAAVFAAANLVEAWLFVGLAEWRLPQVRGLARRGSVLGLLLLSILVAAVGALVVVVGLSVVAGQEHPALTMWLIRPAASATALSRSCRCCSSTRFGAGRGASGRG